MKDSALEIIARHARDGARLREEFFRAQASRLRDAALRAALCLAGEARFCSAATAAAPPTRNIWPPNS